MPRHAFAACLALVLAVLAPVSGTAQTISLVQGMYFGIIEFQTTHNGNVRMGTNGSAFTTGNGMVYSGGAHAGIITITAPTSGVVEVRCDKSANMSNGSSVVTVNRAQASVNTGVDYDNATLCDGIGAAKVPVATIDLGVTPSPNILFAGRAVVQSGELANGHYATAGGNGITVRVTVQ